MNTFVLIFRQNPIRPLSPSQAQELATEMRPWVQQQSADRHKLVPHILERESKQFGAENATAIPREAWLVTALLFIEANDLNDAARVAESHPGLKYGAVVEVRAWSPPPPRAPALDGTVAPAIK
jgi:hypothetical protein